MKKILLTTFFLFSAVAAWAQQGRITATIVDGDTGEGVAGAVVTLIPTSDPEKKQYFTSAYAGVVTIPPVSYTHLTLPTTF